MKKFYNAKLRSSFSRFPRFFKQRPVVSIALSVKLLQLKMLEKYFSKFFYAAKFSDKYLIFFRFWPIFFVICSIPLSVMHWDLLIFEVRTSIFCLNFTLHMKVIRTLDLDKFQFLQLSLQFLDQKSFDNFDLKLSENVSFFTRKGLMIILLKEMIFSSHLEIFYKKFDLSVLGI